MSPEEFADEINDLTGNRYPSKRGGVRAYVGRALLRLLEVRTEMLILDDAQYLFFNRREDSVDEMFKLVKKIADGRRVQLLLVGEERVNDYIENQTPLKNRDWDHEELTPLTSSANDMKKFGKLLGSIDKRLPFAESSKLGDYGEDMYRFSGGMIGIVMNLVQAAAAFAMNNGRACIAIDDFRQAVRTRVRKSDDHNYFGYKSHER